MMALLMSGQADIVIAGAVAILRGIARGAPVVVVGGHLNRMSYALMTDKRLKTVADLKGKTIGITGIGGMGEFTVVESLRRHGLIKDRDFSVVNIEGGPAARMAALKTGKVQAVPLTPGQRVQAESDGFTVLLDTRETLTEIPSTIVASTREFAGSNPDKAVRFLRALDKANDLIRRDKDKAVALGIRPRTARRRCPREKSPGLLRGRSRHPPQEGKHRGSFETNRYPGCAAEIFR